MTQLTLFDYQQLDTETRIVVQQRINEIRGLVKRTAQGVVEIGEKLIDVKKRLERGQFDSLVLSEFGWSRAAAYRFIQVAEQFGDLSQIETIGPSALYLLASPSTPDKARQEAIERAQQGEAITHTKAKEIVAEHRPAPAPPPQSTFESVQPVIDAEIVDEDAAVASVISELRKVLPDPDTDPPLVDLGNYDFKDPDPSPDLEIEAETEDPASEPAELEAAASALPSVAAPPLPPTPAPALAVPPPPPPVIGPAMWRTTFSYRQGGPAPLVSIFCGDEPHQTMPADVTEALIKAIEARTEQPAPAVSIASNLPVEVPEWLPA